MEIKELIAKAWKDEAFKRNLLDDPRTTIEKELGITLPAGVNIHIHEQSDTDIHLILPGRPD